LLDLYIDLYTLAQISQCFQLVDKNSGVPCSARDKAKIKIATMS
jgi:hypothetical protein